MLINLDNLRVLARNNEAFVQEILGVYLDNTPKDLVNMRNAVEDSDWHLVRYFAHKLKSSSFTIGFIEGHRRFQEIEHRIKNEDDIDGVPALFYEAVDACDRCIIEVKQELAKHPSLTKK